MLYRCVLDIGRCILTGERVDKTADDTGGSRTGCRMRCGWLVGVMATLALSVTAHAQSPGVSLSTGTNGTLTINEGSTATYDVWLDSAPTANVTVTPMSGNEVVATVSPATLTFTPTSWGSNDKQTVTVTAVENDIDERDPGPPLDGWGRTQITHTVAGGNYDTVTASNVLIAKRDNDQRDIVYWILNRDGDLEESGSLGSPKAGLEASSYRSRRNPGRIRGSNSRSVATPPNW